MERYIGQVCYLRVVENVYIWCLVWCLAWPRELKVSLLGKCVKCLFYASTSTVKSQFIKWNRNWCKKLGGSRNQVQISPNCSPRMQKVTSNNQEVQKIQCLEKQDSNTNKVSFIYVTNFSYYSLLHLSVFWTSSLLTQKSFNSLY